MFYNGTVNLYCSTTKITYNIRRIKPSKYETEVEDSGSKICATMSTYDCQLYNFLSNNRACKQVIQLDYQGGIDGKSS